MTKADRDHLRELAVAASGATMSKVPYSGSAEYDRFIWECSPHTVLALLDALDAAERTYEYTGSFRVELLVCYLDGTWRTEVMHVPCSFRASCLTEAMGVAKAATEGDDTVHVHVGSAWWVEKQGHG
jgi:hypothetical protein